MDLSTWLLLFLAVVIWLFLRTRSPKVTNLPPGPYGLPLIGYVWILFRDWHVAFTELAKKWGDIFCISVLGQKIVVLNTMELMRDAFASQTRGDSVSGRTRQSFDLPNVIGFSTTFLQPGTQWKQQRKLVYKILNMYGEGVQGVEDVVHDELKHAVKWLESTGPSVNMDKVLWPSLINVLTILLTGRREEYGSDVLKNVQAMDETVAEAGAVRNTLPLTVFPFLKYIPIGPGRLYQQLQRIVVQFLKDYYEETKATYNPDVTRGMIDFLLRHQEESRDPDGTVWLTDRAIQAIIQETIGAGSITTRGALSSFFLIIAQNQNVMRKIQSEIDSVVGAGRLPSLQDRADMPYTMAAMLELLRYISHAPLGLPHMTTEEVLIEGYLIPSGTTVMANTWLIHHDPVLWSHPWDFTPERFLDEHGKLIPADYQLRKALMPFGVGRRSCIGESFAKSRMFLFITTLLQKFNFSPDPARPLPPSDPRQFEGGLIITPREYHVLLTPQA